MRAVFVDANVALRALAERIGRETLPQLEIGFGPADITPDALPDALAGAPIAVVDHTALPIEIARRCTGLRDVVFLGTGARSYMDPEALAELGIAVHVIKGYGDTAVAECAVGLLFAAARGFAAMDGAMRDGRWLRSEGVQLGSKTLGLVGFGGIAAEVARLALGCGMKVVAWNRSTKKNCSGVEFVSIDELLARSDAVSMHLLLCDETRGFLSRERIASMRPGAILVNTARGALVDEAAMVDALRSGHLRHAGLDVFDIEPLPASHVLATLPNVTLSAHSGFRTPEANERLIEEAIAHCARIVSCSTGAGLAMTALPAIELRAPDISRWRDGGTGVDWVHVLDSGRPGPKVMVQALTHGNEICGAIALDWLLAQRFRPSSGSLTLAFANVAAYARFDPSDPFPSRLVDEDYNRVWADATLSGPGDTVELRRARELRSFVDAAERLLDIHSMSEPCRPLMVCGMVDKNAAFARELGVPADLLVDTGHPAGLRMVDRGGFGDERSPKLALLIECGQHWESGAADVAIDTLVRFLGLTGVADPGWVREHVRLPLPPVQRLVRVTEPVVALSAGFSFLVPPVGLSVLAKAGTPIAQDGDHVWTTPYDDAVLVMPGTRNLKPGGTAVRIGRFEDR